MQNLLFALSLGFGGLILAQQAAQAQAQNAPCAKREQIIERLHTRYGETRQSMGLGRNNGVVETYASADTGTWTIVITLPTGMTCLIAAGQSYESVVEETALLDEEA